MDAKEYLQQIRILESSIQQRKKELDTLQEIATTIKSFDYTKDRVQVSPSGEASFVKTAERVAVLDDEISRLEDERLEIIASIDSTGDRRYIEVLYRRYVDGQAFDKIAKAMHYHIGTVYKLHSSALEKMVVNAKIDVL